MWIENKKSYRIRQAVCVILGFCAAWTFTMAVCNRQEAVAARHRSAAQKELSQEVLRFHVLANSDEEADQNLKLLVRDQILSYMEDSMLSLDCVTVDDSKRWVRAHLDEIEDEATAVIRQEGFSYSVRANVSECYFPDRKYGTVLFPKGYYEALRVEIGNGSGHNWWCVLYPSLCFTDSTCAVVTEESEQELQNVLSEESYEAVTVTSHNFKIKSFFWEIFRKETSD